MTRDEVEKIVEDARSKKTRAYLNEIDLEGVNLRRADLSEADLNDSNLREVILIGADLSYANLRRTDLYQADCRKANFNEADLGGANLSYADLRYARLNEVNTEGANLSYATLRRANLSEANIYRANLSGADLSGANLNEAGLCGANLSGAILPSPQAILAAYWGTVSESTCVELMRYDCASHPNGTEAFNKWAFGGECPYDDCRFKRAANFEEQGKLWSPGPSKTPIELAQMVLDEKCPGWRGKK